MWMAKLSQPTHPLQNNTKLSKLAHHPHSKSASNPLQQRLHNCDRPSWSCDDGTYQSVTTSWEYVWLGTDFALASPKSASFNSPGDYQDYCDDHDHHTNSNDDNDGYESDLWRQLIIIIVIMTMMIMIMNTMMMTAKSASFNFTSILRKPSLSTKFVTDVDNF